MSRLILIFAILFQSAAFAADPVIIQVACPDQQGQTTKMTQADLVSLLSSGKPGSYTFLLLSVGGEGVSVRECSITIADKTDKPAEPPAEPPFVSQFGLEKKAVEWIRQVPADSAKYAQRLSLAYLTSVQEIDNGTLTTVEELNKAQAKTNAALLGENLAAWKPWGESCIKELDTLNKAGVLKTLEQHRQAWLEIATGLNGGK
jgi:hypothetical protein